MACREETRCGPTSVNSRADVNSDGICVSGGNNGLVNTIPQGDDRISRGAVIDGRDRVCDTAAGQGTDDVQVTPVGQTPAQPDILNSADDWAGIIYDPLLASRFNGAPAVKLEADALTLLDARLDLAFLMAPQITLQQSGPTTAKPGDLVTFSTKITNTGERPGDFVVSQADEPGWHRRDVRSRSRDRRPGVD